MAKTKTAAATIDAPPPPPADTPAPPTFVQQYVELTRIKRDLDDQLKGVNGKLDELESKIMDKWLNDGVTQMVVDDMTIYIQHDIRVATGEGKSSVDVADALRKAKLADLTTANWQRMRSWVKELPTDNEGKPIVPKALAAVLKIEPYSKLCARKRS